MTEPLREDTYNPQGLMFQTETRPIPTNQYPQTETSRPLNRTFTDQPGTYSPYGGYYPQPNYYRQTEAMQNFQHPLSSSQGFNQTNTASYEDRNFAGQNVVDSQMCYGHDGFKTAHLPIQSDVEFLKKFGCCYDCISKLQTRPDQPLCYGKSGHEDPHPADPEIFKKFKLCIECVPPPPPTVQMEIPSKPGEKRKTAKFEADQILLANFLKCIEDVLSSSQKKYLFKLVTECELESGELLYSKLKHISMAKNEENWSKKNHEADAFCNMMYEAYNTPTVTYAYNTKTRKFMVYGNVHKLIKAEHEGDTKDSETGKLSNSFIIAEKFIMRALREHERVIPMPTKQQSFLAAVVISAAKGIKNKKEIQTTPFQIGQQFLNRNIETLENLNIEEESSGNEETDDEEGAESGGEHEAGEELNDEEAANSGDDHEPELELDRSSNIEGDRNDYNYNQEILSLSQEESGDDHSSGKEKNNSNEDILNLLPDPTTPIQDSANLKSKKSPRTYLDISNNIMNPEHFQTDMQDEEQEEQFSFKFTGGQDLSQNSVKKLGKDKEKNKLKRKLEIEARGLNGKLDESKAEHNHQEENIHGLSGVKRKKTEIKQKQKLNKNGKALQNKLDIAEKHEGEVAEDCKQRKCKKEALGEMLAAANTGTKTDSRLGSNKDMPAKINKSSINKIGRRGGAATVNSEDMAAVKSGDGAAVKRGGGATVKAGGKGSALQGKGSATLQGKGSATLQGKGSALQGKGSALKGKGVATLNKEVVAVRGGGDYVSRGCGVNVKGGDSSTGKGGGVSTQKGGGLSTGRGGGVSTQKGGGLSTGRGGGVSTQKGGGLSPGRGGVSTQKGGGLSIGRGSGVSTQKGGLSTGRGGVSTQKGGGLSIGRGGGVSTQKGGGLSTGRGRGVPTGSRGGASTGCGGGPSISRRGASSGKGEVILPSVEAEVQPRQGRRGKMNGSAVEDRREMHPVKERRTNNGAEAGPSMT